jgi:hypothetical protein
MQSNSQVAAAFPRYSVGPISRLLIDRLFGDHEHDQTQRVAAATLLQEYQASDVTDLRRPGTLLTVACRTQQQRPPSV